MSYFVFRSRTTPLYASAFGYLRCRSFSRSSANDASSIASSKLLDVSVDQRHLSEAGSPIVEIAHLHKPLIRQIRLDRRLTAVGVRKFDVAVFDVADEAKLVEVGDDAVAGFGNRESLVGARVLVERAVGIE